VNILLGVTAAYNTFKLHILLLFSFLLKVRLSMVFPDHLVLTSREIGTFRREAIII